jgi:hypothetical protein
VNLAGIDLAHRPYTNPAERNSRVYVTEETNGTYYQATPDADWTLEDATVRPWVDWSRYYTQAETKPTIILRSHVTGESAQKDPHVMGYDYKPATKTVYFYEAGKIRKNTTADGTTWAGDSVVVDLPVAFPAGGLGTGCELDPVRQYVYAYGDTSKEFQVYDIGGTAWTDLKQADDAGYGYWAPVYVPELDAILCLRGTTVTGPAFQIAAFRGKSRLWVKSFPNVLIKSESVNENYIYPTHTLRSLNGALCAVCISDGTPQFITSRDQFTTYQMGDLTTSSSTARYFGSRILDQYRIFTYVGTTPRGYQTAAPFYAGVVSYADFAGKSCAEGLKDLAVLTNAAFWVDDDAQGHFVARDLYDPGAVTALDDALDYRAKERSQDAIWDQAVSYVEVSGGSVADAVVAGDHDFAASGLSISSNFLPNEAFGQALAQSYFDFFGRRRAFEEVPVIDPDGRIYQPLDRVTINGIRYLVYESDHNLVDDSIDLKLLEDV